MDNCTLIRVGRHVVGEVRGDTFFKRVRASKHFLRVPLAISTDDTALSDAEQVGAVRLQVTDEDSGRVYSAPIELIRSKGIRLNRGHGDQFALPLDKWQCSGETHQLTFDVFQS